MHRYNPLHLSATGNAETHQDLRSRDDRESSVSGSENNYGHYLQGAKDDPDSPEDPHLALTSQTLNADGTPKRPMNAFMIYARKRRPQISAANQMMRTGDISKILSKEWNSMDMSDKKFYLEQAKKLKDSFNVKYPDYVYRRRPNNTRKKRKVDPGQPSPTVDNDDASLDEVSPLEDDSSVDHIPPSFQYSRSHQPSTYESNDHLLPTHSLPPFYQPEMPPSNLNQINNRLPGLSSTVDTSSTAPLITPLRIPSQTDSGPHPQSYHFTSSQHGRPQSPTIHSAQDSYPTQNNWDSSRAVHRVDHGRPGSANWPVLPALDMSVTRRGTGNNTSAISARSEAFSPQLPHRPWSSAASSASSSSGGASQYPASPFPTLASPFYPPQSPTQRHAVASPTSYIGGGSPEYFTPGPSQLPRGMSTTDRHNDGSQEHFAHSPALPQPTASAYLPGAQNHWGPQYTRTGSDNHQRTSTIQPIATYSMQPHPANGTSPASASPGNHVAYWERNRYEGR